MKLARVYYVIVLPAKSINDKESETSNSLVYKVRNFTRLESNPLVYEGPQRYTASVVTLVYKFPRYGSTESSIVRCPCDTNILRCIFQFLPGDHLIPRNDNNISAFIKFHIHLLRSTLVILVVHRFLLHQGSGPSYWTQSLLGNTSRPIFRLRSALASSRSVGLLGGILPFRPSTYNDQSRHKW